MKTLSEIEKAFSEGEWLKLGIKERLSVEKRLGISYVELQELFLMAKKGELFDTLKKYHVLLKEEGEVQKQQLKELIEKQKKLTEEKVSLCGLNASLVKDAVYLQRSYDKMSVELNNTKISLDIARLRLEEAKKKPTT